MDLSCPKTKQKGIVDYSSSDDDKSPNRPNLSPTQQERTRSISDVAASNLSSEKNKDTGQVPAPSPSVANILQGNNNKNNSISASVSMPPNDLNSSASISQLKPNENTASSSVASSSMPTTVRKDSKQENSNPVSSMTAKRKLSSSSNKASTLAAEDKQQNKPTTSALNSALTPKRKNRWDVKDFQTSSADSSCAASVSAAATSMLLTGNKGNLGQRTANADDENINLNRGLSGKSSNFSSIFLAPTSSEKPLFGGNPLSEDDRRKILEDAENYISLNEEKQKSYKKFDDSDSYYKGYTFTFHGALRGPSAKRHIEEYVDNKGFPPGFNNYEQLKVSLIDACIEGIKIGKTGSLRYKGTVEIKINNLTWCIILLKKVISIGK